MAVFALQLPVYVGRNRSCLLPFFLQGIEFLKGMPDVLLFLHQFVQVGNDLLLDLQILLEFMGLFFLPGLSQLIELSHQFTESPVPDHRAGV